MVNLELVMEAIRYFSAFDLVFVAIGVLLGVVFAAIPGLSGSIGIAILLPFTYLFAPVTALATLGGLYVGSMYGGSVSAVLLNIPGTGAAVATAIDGYPLAQQGRAQEALYASALASFVGGMIGVVFLLVLIQPLARLSLKFGPPEFFWLAVLGISTIGSLTAKNLLKGLLMGLFGLFLSTIGLDPLMGRNRFTFGISQLTGGIPIIPIIIAMFAVPQVLRYLEDQTVTIGEYVHRKGIGMAVAGQMFRRMKLLILKSSVIGTIVGIVPGAGGYVASLVAYIEAKGSSSDPDEYGKGKLEGVVVAEAANSATVGGAMVPTLTFGIPGSNVTAVLIGALLMHGFQPGPRLFLDSGDVVMAFVLSLFVSYLIMLAYGTYGPKFFSQVLRIKRNYVVAVLLVICILGAYSIRGNTYDVVVMFVLGCIGYLLMKLDFPLQPVVLGLVLGSIAERGLRHSIQFGSLTDSMVGYFFLRPISLTLILLTVLLMLFPVYQERRALKKRASAQGLRIRVHERKARLCDVLVGCAVVLAAGAGLLHARVYDFGARVFPVTVLSAVAVLGVGLVVTNLTRRQWASAGEGRWASLRTIPLVSVAQLLAVYALFIWAFMHVGFVVSSFVFMIFALLISDSRHYSGRELAMVTLRYTFSSLLINIVIYIVFLRILNIYMPTNVMDLFVAR